MVDYKKLKLKVGLEIHQQLEGRKLFCHCPTLVNDPNKPNFTFSRRLRAVVGEEGKKDIAAEYEQAKEKTYVYEACKTSSCNVEFDEEPPHDISEFALDTALIVSLLMNAELVDEIQVMRKTVVDGSNVSGFQRTMLVSRDGYINTSKGKVGISIICLEEEAAKKIKEVKDKVFYSLDRLGVPLLEIATCPDIKDPEHAKEVAGIIGMILRSTSRVKRGLGSIRQDINLSIKNGARVELKGFQDLRSIPRVVENEVKRHLELIKKSGKVKEEVRKVEPSFSTSYLRPMPGAARMYPETDVSTFRVTKARLNMLKLPELIVDRAANFERKYGINAKLASEIIKENIPFDYYAEKYKISPSFIAQVLIEMPKEIKSRLNIKNKLSKKDFELVFDNLEKKKINKDAVLDILAELSKKNKVNLDKYKPVDTDKIEEDIKKIVEKGKGLSFNAVMGDVMKKYHGKIDGKKAAEIIKKYIK